MIFMNIAKNGYFHAEKSRLSLRDSAYINLNNLQMMIFENDPNIEKAISSSWAHWLYIHFVGEWYTEWPFHSFSDRVNIDYKGQRFRVKISPIRVTNGLKWGRFGDKTVICMNIQDDSFWFVHKKSWIINKSESVPTIELQFTIDLSDFKHFVSKYLYKVTSSSGTK